MEFRTGKEKKNLPSLFDSTPVSSPIDFFGISHQQGQQDQQYWQGVDQILRSGNYYESEIVRTFESAFANFVGRKKAVGVASGTDALFFALKALGIGPGDEVIVTSFSFISSASCIARVGAIPVFVDIDKRFQMDAKKIEEKITSKTKAILVVHLFGLLAEIDIIQSIAKSYKLFLIEDCSQAIGARKGIISAGERGVLSCFSFNPTKVLGGIQHGGAVVGDDTELLKSVDKLSHHGRESKNQSVSSLGVLSRLSSLNAHHLLWGLRQLPGWIQQRQKIIESYIESLGSCSGVQSMPIGENDFVNGHKFVVSCRLRDELLFHLASKGVPAQVHYQRSFCQEPIFGAKETCKNSVAAARSALSLPVHPGLSALEVAKICDIVLEFYSSF